MYNLFRNRDRRQSARQLRAILPQFLTLENRSYTSALPTFFRDTSLAYGPGQAISTSFVPSVFDPDMADWTATDTEAGDAGATTGTNKSNDLMASEDDPPVALVSASEAGTVSNSIAAPVADPNSNLQAVELDVSHSHTDSVTAASNVLYGFGETGGDSGPFQETEARPENPMHYNLTESDGSAITSGSVTVTFTVTLSSMAPRGADGLQFDREADLVLSTTFLTATVFVGGDGGGHSGGADGLSISDSNGDTYSDTTFGEDPSTSSTHTFTAIIPITSNAKVSADYDSYYRTFPSGDLDTTPTGSGTGETDPNVSSFSWSFSMVANP